MTGLKLTVSTYSGYRADERPTAFVLAGRTFAVQEVVDRWYGEGDDWFKLIADDGNLYLIRHDRSTDQWELVMSDTSTGTPHKTACE